MQGKGERKKIERNIHWRAVHPYSYSLIFTSSFKSFDNTILGFCFIHSQIHSLRFLGVTITELCWLKNISILSAIGPAAGAVNPLSIRFKEVILEIAIVF